MNSIDPNTGRTLESFEPLGDDALEARLARAASAFADWRRTPLDERTRILARTADVLERGKQEYARTMTREMGKPLVAAVSEVEKCVWVCRYYADEASGFLAPREVETSAARSFIAFQPIGPVLAVMPWNFPFWQVFRFAVPALAAGNVGLLKHASSVPRCALLIEEIFREAGLPDGVFQTLLIESAGVRRVIDDPRVAAVTLTGSEGAGRAVGEAAGANLKKSVLELGGSDPFIVMPSADLEAAVTTAVKARVINNGQSCIAAKRFIVHERIMDRFRHRFVETMRALRVGDPMDDATDVGPLATESIRDDLHAQVRMTVDAGAGLLLGGHPLDRPGWFYAPTVLDSIPDESPAACDELFGPVASLFTARDIDHAIELANATTFGLGASVWTNDRLERDRFIAEIDAGLVFVNAMVASDPRLPFGGVKASGYGRELAEFGIREFVNIKSVSIEGSDARAVE